MDHKCYLCKPHREFHGKEALARHRWLRHGTLMESVFDVRSRKTIKRLKYPAPPLPADLLEAAYERKRRAMLLLRDQAEEFSEREVEAGLQLEMLREALMLDLGGKNKQKAKVSRPARLTKNNSLSGAKKAEKKGRPPQPAGKPYWDSKHGRWTDNEAYKPKRMPSTSFGPGSRKRSAKKLKADGAENTDLSRLDAAGDGSEDGGD